MCRWFSGGLHASRACASGLKCWDWVSKSCSPPIDTALSALAKRYASSILVPWLIRPPTPGKAYSLSRPLGNRVALPPLAMGCCRQVRTSRFYHPGPRKCSQFHLADTRHRCPATRRAGRPSCAGTGLPMAASSIRCARRESIAGHPALPGLRDAQTCGFIAVARRRAEPASGLVCGASRTGRALPTCSGMRS